MPNVDKLWLAEFDENKSPREQKKAARAKRLAFGASKSGRKIDLSIEEHAEAVGTGPAAEAAAMALQAKEEGRRLDSLTINALEILKEAVATYKDICLTLKDRTAVLEKTHVRLLDSYHTNRIALTEAEVELVQRAKSDDGDDEAKGLLQAIVAKHLGLDGDDVDGKPGKKKA